MASAVTPVRPVPNRARALWLSLVSLVLGILVVLVGAATASAHAGLVSSDPADGAALSSPPASVSLVFSEDLMPDFVAISVTDGQGQPVAVRGLSITGATAQFDWPADAPTGAYTVAFRIVSQDGHPVEGAIGFTYSAPTPSPTSATASPTTSSASPPPTSASPEPTPTDVSPTPAPSPSPTVDPITPTSATSSTGWILAIVAIGVAAVIAIVIVVARRR